MKEPTLTCLYYHRVSPHKEKLSVSPELFESQLKTLAGKGYQTVSIKDLAGFLSGKSLPARNPLMLSFDDGFLDFYHYAFPLLKKYGMTAVVFLVPNWMNESDSLELSVELRQEMAKSSVDHAVRSAHQGDRRLFLTWKMAAEMAGSGAVEFGSHTMSHRIGFVSGKLRKFITSEHAHWKYEELYGGAVHPGYPVFERASDVAVRCFLPGKAAVEKLVYFAQKQMKETGASAEQLEAALYKFAGTLGPLGDFESEKDARSRILNDFQKSKAVVEKKLGTKCSCLCWPFGDYSDLAVDLAGQAGYKIAFTTERGSVKRGDNPLALRRYRVEPVSGTRLWLELRVLSAPGIGAIISGQSRSRKVVQKIEDKG
jgi:peptidoglycan/xylan/chitin deacetylase (PgdA/CDA1 family)